MGFPREVTNEDLRWYAGLQRRFPDESDTKYFLKRTDQLGRYLFVSGVIGRGNCVMSEYQRLMQEEQGELQIALLEQVLNLD